MIREEYMARCIELARLGAGCVAPNPMVGAVLVHDDRIIGEGWHRKYGEAHAEVNCLRSVAGQDMHLVSQSTLYVSLEPCAHFGKTPPCSDLIIAQKIPKVVIGCRDVFNQGNGRGIEKLNAAGVEVVFGVMESECKDINRRFFTFHTLHRPYVILKWAQTSNGFIGSGNGERLMISTEYTNRLVHRWRSEEAAILVGTNTALLDDPELTNRLWEGPTPVRLLVDMDLSLPHSLRIFNSRAKTIVFNTIKHEETAGIIYYQVTSDVNLVHQILNALYQMKILSVIVEGGAKLLQSFIDDGSWDEARIITNEISYNHNGILAPQLPVAHLQHEFEEASDSIRFFRNQPN